MAQLAVGERAPNVDLVGPGGAAVPTSSLWGERPVVLYFYPKDHTLGCTKEACAFRDAYEDFLAAGADVVGVSADGEESHASFADRHRLPFRLLSDPSGAARAAFGVKKVLGFFDGRVTFVIDREGVVRHTFSSAIDMGGHVTAALSTVRSLR